jgi:hypothetical protein
MKRLMLSLAVCGALAGGAVVSAPLAEAKPGGCLKYGAAGAVAGHVAGGHGFKGALVGCAVGMYQRHKYNKEQRELRRQQGL